MRPCKVCCRDKRMVKGLHIVGYRKGDVVFRAKYESAG